MLEELHPPCRRVLVVEDRYDPLPSLALLLSYWGHEVRSTFDVSTALDLACVFRPDVVLVDVDLPCADGFALARRLRQQPVLHHARIGTVSGVCREEERRLSLEAGCACHLAKPVQPELLRRFLRDSCPHAGTEGAGR
jgi:CheY-like chemotaxis protein